MKKAGWRREKRGNRGKDGLFESAFKHGLVFVSSPLTHSWTGDLVVCCPWRARVTFSYPSRGIYWGVEAKVKSGPESCRLQRQQDWRGTTAGGSWKWQFGQYCFHSPQVFLLLHARMCWLAIMGKVIGSQRFQMQPVSVGAESSIYLHRMWSIYII